MRRGVQPLGSKVSMSVPFWRRVVAMATSPLPAAWSRSCSSVMGLLPCSVRCLSLELKIAGSGWFAASSGDISKSTVDFLLMLFDFRSVICQRMYLMWLQRFRTHNFPKVSY